MFRKILLQLRKIYVVNYLGRIFIRSIFPFSKKLYFSLSNHWAVKGIVPIRFLGFNFKMKSNCDDGVVDRLYYRHTHPEQSELFVFSVLSKHSKTIIDIGAHTGIYSIIAAKSNPQTTIYSFEPHPFNYQRFKSHIELNNLTKVQAINKAVGDTVSAVEFNIPDDNRITDVASMDKSFSTTMYKGEFDWKVVKAEQISIDIFCDQQKISKVDLIKLDVENYELPVFKGMQHTIKINRPYILCELFHTEEKLAFIDGILQSENYYVYDFTENGLMALSSIRSLPTGLNYLLSPINLSQSISYQDFETKMLSDS